MSSTWWSERSAASPRRQSNVQSVRIVSTRQQHRRQETKRHILISSHVIGPSQASKTFSCFSALMRIGAPLQVWQRRSHHQYACLDSSKNTQFLELLHLLGEHTRRHSRGTLNLEKFLHSCRSGQPKGPQAKSTMLLGSETPCQ